MDSTFLVRPPLLNQASESGSGGGITRRAFIKRTGGATVAVLVTAAAMRPQTAAGAVDASWMDGSIPESVALSGCWHDWDAKPSVPGGPPPNPSCKCSKCKSEANPPLPWFSVQF